MAENSSTKLEVKACGDGLYFFGGDIFCVYPIKGVKHTDNSATYQYEKYDVVVSWTNVDAEGLVRVNPKWERIYK